MKARSSHSRSALKDYLGPSDDPVTRTYGCLYIQKSSATQREHN